MQQYIITTSTKTELTKMQLKSNLKEQFHQKKLNSPLKSQIMT